MNDLDEDIYDVIEKVLLIGDSGVGKTNMVTKYINNEFNDNSKATVGVEFCYQKITIDGKKINAQIWDTAGQEKFKAITSSFYKGAKACFIVFDITNKSTFENVDKWIANVNSLADKGVLIILIGNKNDLEDLRQVTTEEAEVKAKAFNVAYMETSAKSGQNIKEAFEMLLKGAMKVVLEGEKGEDFDILVENNKKLKPEGKDVIPKSENETEKCSC